MRRSLLLLILAISAVSPVRAHHCNEITFYTGVGAADARPLTWDPASWLGCGVEHRSTDYLIPGSSFGQVFFSAQHQPEFGTLQIGDEVVELTWTQGRNSGGALAHFWYSQTVDFPVELSLLPGSVLLPTVCRDVDDCLQRPYRSVTTP